VFVRRPVLQQLAQVLGVLSTTTAAIGASDTAENAFDSNAQVSFAANSLASNQVYRIRLLVKTTAGTGQVTVRTYFGASAGSGAHFDFAAFTHQNNAVTVLMLTVRLTAGGATAQALVVGERTSNGVQPVLSDGNLNTTFDATAAVLLSFTAQFSASNASNSAVIEGMTVER
jgi:hypothetical protein